MTTPTHSARRACLQGASGLALGMTLGPALLWPTGAHAQITQINEAINKAGRQRMLSQRMAKAWLAIGQGVDVAKAERILGDSMALFDRQLVELKAYAPKPDIRQTYQRLEAEWSRYKEALVGTAPRQSASAALLAQDARVLALAHQGTMQLEQVSGRPVGKLVNTAGRQRMLSQRSAKFYLSLSWSTGEEAQQRQELDKARREFTQALDVLQQAPEATEAIRDEIAIARQQWVFFDNALTRMGQNGRSVQHATEVLRSSENILQSMDRVTGLYARLS